MANDPSVGRLLAGVDIGTLTCRLLVARVSDDRRVQAVHADRRLLRLGEGVARGRRLQPAPIARVLAALRDWRAVIRRLGVEAESAVATSAVRDAENREEFLALAEREAGFAVEVLTGEEEARRTVLGIRSGLPAGVGAILGLDIGGGSTEFIHDRPGRPPALRSVNIGVVRLTEDILHDDPPSPAQVRAAADLVAARTRAVLAELDSPEGATFVGTAGTITSLAAMVQRLPAYEPARIHNFRLALDRVRALEGQMLRLRAAERRGLPGLEAGREDVIVAGTLILRVAMETLGVTDCLVSDLGLREGIVLDLAERLECRET